MQRTHVLTTRRAVALAAAATMFISIVAAQSNLPPERSRPLQSA